MEKWAYKKFGCKNDLSISIKIIFPLEIRNFRTIGTFMEKNSSQYLTRSDSSPFFLAVRLQTPDSLFHYGSNFLSSELQVSHPDPIMSLGIISKRARTRLSGPRHLRRRDQNNAAVFAGRRGGHPAAFVTKFAYVRDCYDFPTESRMLAKTTINACRCGG